MGQGITVSAIVAALSSILVLLYQYLNGINPISDRLPEDIRLTISTRIFAGNNFAQHEQPESNSSPPEDESQKANLPLATSQSAYFSTPHDRIIQRINREIQALDRRGNINLIIGVGTTLAAVAILASTLFQGAPVTQDSVELLSHFGPRVTLSLFIEFFSFFFLKLYNSGLQDIKYYQNELTNIETKFIAMQNSFEHGDKSTISKILISLSLTERNFILKKGETTQDLERFKASQQSEKELLAALGAIAKQNLPQKVAIKTP